MSTTLTQDQGLVTDEGSGDQSSLSDPAEDTPEKGSSQRDYVVFEESGNRGWVEVKTVMAANGEAAISSLGSDLKESSRYFAVTARSFRPGKPTVKTTTTIQISFD